jgi:DUF2914 family protein
LARVYIPPAPLRLVDAQFGGTFDRQTMQLTPIWRELEAGQGISVWGLTAIRAPLGLRDKVQHRWYRNGRRIWVSPLYEVTGGRKAGFRLWTSYDFANLRPGATVRVDVATEGGQLIGRAAIKVTNARLRPTS